MRLSPGISCPCIFAVVTGVFLFGIIAQSAASEQPETASGVFSIGLGFDYASGTFGTDTRTHFVSVPLTIDYRPTNRSYLELVIPYVYQSNSTTVYGTTMPYNYQGAAVKGVARFMSGPGAGGAGGAATGDGTYDSSSSEGGLGDITLTGGYEMLAEGELLPYLWITGYVKFPTADKDKGLGTGEVDFGPGLSLGKWFGTVNLYAEGRYVFQGQSDLYATDDYVSYTAGVGYQVSSSLYLAMAVAGATPPASGSPELFEGRLRFNWNIMENKGLEGYVSRGFTNGSPDYGASLALFHHF